MLEPVWHVTRNITYALLFFRSTLSVYRVNKLVKPTSAFTPLIVSLLKYNQYLSD
jgi:hypothetical protein